MDKEIILDAYVNATAKHEATEIATAIGIEPQDLYGFKARLMLGKSKLTKLADWLARHDYLPESYLLRAPKKLLSVWALLASELRALADILDADGVSDRVKGARFQSFVEDYFDAGDRYTARDKRSKD